MSHLPWHSISHSVHSSNSSLIKHSRLSRHSRSRPHSLQSRHSRLSMHSWLSSHSLHSRHSSNLSRSSGSSSSWHSMLWSKQTIQCIMASAHIPQQQHRPWTGQPHTLQHLHAPIISPAMLNLRHLQPLSLCPAQLTLLVLCLLSRTSLMALGRQT